MEDGGSVSGLGAGGVVVGTYNTVVVDVALKEPGGAVETVVEFHDLLDLVVWLAVGYLEDSPYSRRYS